MTADPKDDITVLELKINTLEFKINALTDGVRDLSITVKEQYGVMHSLLDVLRQQQLTAATLLRLVVGDGEPGQGRLGQAEKSIEMLKRYWWQFAGAIAVGLFIVDLVFRK